MLATMWQITYGFILSSHGRLSRSLGWLDRGMGSVVRGGNGLISTSSPSPHPYFRLGERSGLVPQLPVGVTVKDTRHRAECAVLRYGP